MKNIPKNIEHGKELKSLGKINSKIKLNGFSKPENEHNDEELPMKRFKGTKSWDVQSNGIEAEDKKKKSKHQNKQVETEEKLKTNKKVKMKDMICDPSELMSKLEQFSEVWNDCPSAQDNIWYGGDYNEPMNREQYDEPATTSSTKNKWNNKTTPNDTHVTRESKQHKEGKHSDIKNKTNPTPETITSSLNSTEDNKNVSKTYDATLADQKRKKAVEEQSKLHYDQKNIIKQALSSTDGKLKVNKKIVFDDAIESKEEKSNSKGEEDTAKKRKQLFNDDDSDNEADLNLNPQFDGKKGQKLLELQSKFASDSRFTLDQRFVDSDSEESATEEPESKTNLEDEKKKQLEILASIVQQDIRPLSEIRKKAKKLQDTILLRFDPTREDHSKYIVKPPEPVKSDDKPTSKKKKKSKADGREPGSSGPADPPPVSTEQFVSVKEDLKEVLTKESGKEFSLLQLFGPAETKNSEVQSEETQSVKKLKHQTKNPFKYDSSESEAEEETPKTEAKTPQAASWRTTFFFTENDSRLQEAFEFLKAPDQVEDPTEYAEKRKMLKDFIRTKFKNNSRKKRPFKKKLGGIRKRDLLQKEKKELI